MNALFAELYKIFFGSITFIHIIEVIFRTSFMYFYAIVNIRIMDTRSMGLLNPFEILIIVALGSSVGDPMFYRDIPLLQGMIVISTIVILERILTKLTMKSRYFERLIDGTPELLIKDGQLQPHILKKENITMDELHSMLRLHGVKTIDEVRYAYLEPSGSVSVIRKNNHNDEANLFSVKHRL